MIHVTSFKLLSNEIKEDLIKRCHLDYPQQNLCWDCWHAEFGESGQSYCGIHKDRIVGRNETCPRFECKRILYNEYIYIGRANRGLKASPLANPFKNKDSKKCLLQYKQMIEKDMFYYSVGVIGESSTLDELNRIGALGKNHKDIYLVCWCKKVMDDNTPCHGDIIKEILEIQGK